MYFVHSSDHPCLWCCAAQKEGGKGSCCRRPHYCDIALCKMFKAAAVTADCTDRGGGEAAREGGREHRERPMGIRLNSAALRSIYCMLSSSATFTYPLHGIILRNPTPPSASAILSCSITFNLGTLIISIL